MAVLGLSLLGHALYGINDLNNGLGGIQLQDATDPLYLNRIAADYWTRAIRAQQDAPFSLVKEAAPQFISVMHMTPADQIIITRTTTTHELTVIREDGDA